MIYCVNLVCAACNVSVAVFRRWYDAAAAGAAGAAGAAASRSPSLCANSLAPALIRRATNNIIVIVYSYIYQYAYFFSSHFTFSALSYSVMKCQPWYSIFKSPPWYSIAKRPP